MATNAKAAAKPADPTATAPKSSKKTLFIIIGAVVAVILAGGGGWYFAKGKSHDAHVEEVKVAPPKTPIFVPLEPFTVNLHSESSDQYLQIGISMKMFEPEIDAKIKTNLPEIRSKILQLLTTKTATELLTAEGKNKLVKEIVTMSNAVIGIFPAPAPVAAPLPVAAPQVDAHGNTVEAAPAVVHDAVPVNVPAPAAPAEKKGIIDVLFTSFIIQ